MAFDAFVALEVDATKYLDLIAGRRRGVWAALQRAGLRLASWPYAAVMRLRNWAYDCGWARVYRAAAPVLAVGNLTVGGTGKTPCVEYLARWLRKHDVQVAILSRGYGAAEGPNDEALLLEENLPDVPHLQGVDRVELAATAVAELESAALILDDGFQHRRLARDVDLVLLDTTNPWGYGALLPRGLMRESIRGLRRATAVLLTRCEQTSLTQIATIEQRIRSIAPNVPILHCEHRPCSWLSSSGTEVPLDFLVGKTVKAFCGIGNPAAFRKTLDQLDVSVASWREFPDHHRYQRSDVESLQQWSAADECAAVVTTQKDLVKLRLDRLVDRPVLALRIELHITKGAERLHELLKPFLSD